MATSAPKPSFKGVDRPGDQRGRLIAAMLEAISRHGYAETTVSELAALARVSKSTFYAHFADKEECLLATFDAALEEVSTQVGEAYRSRSGLRERLRAAFEAFVEIVVAEPAAASVFIAESLTLGRAGIEAHYRGAAVFEQLLRHSFDQAPERGEISDLTIRAIVGGIRRVVYHCLRAGQPQAMREHVEPLLEWAVSYQRHGGALSVVPLLPPPPLSANGTANGAVNRAGNGALPPSPPGWGEPANGIRSRMRLTQRERIVRATAQLAVSQGYPALSIPAISAAAGVSNQTFYEHFVGTNAAFLAGCEALAESCLVTMVRAEAEEEWSRSRSVAAGVREMLRFAAEDPLFARLAFLELPVAGQEAWEQGDLMASRLTGALGAGVPRTAAGAALPGIVADAIGGGIWTLMHYEIAAGRTALLPDLTPEVAFVALGPLTAAEAEKALSLTR